MCLFYRSRRTKEIPLNLKRNIMENEEYLCINCAKKIECYGPDIKLEEPDLCIPISCIDYQDIEEKFN
nr:MAG TPA: hypothetical protein [Caudoviricetes sp.]